MASPTKFPAPNLAGSVLKSGKFPIIFALRAKKYYFERGMTKYFLYVRKSTEDEDRQVLSLEAQKAELYEFALKEKLDIIKTFEESQTAKEPGRPVFNKMLEEIEKGKAFGILAWHPDRLARNSVDGGKIIYLVDSGKIRELKFPTFWFENTPQGKFMLNIAFGQSKYYVDNLSENVKRGLRQKLRRGERPGLAPVGYLNELRSRTLIKDPERFRFIKKLFELYSAGKYSLKDLREKMSSAGLRSRKGKKLSVSVIQHILSNPVYYGAFKYKGELYQGKHEPLISKELFDKVQKVVTDKSKPKKRKPAKQRAFRGLFKCGECGCAITSETQKGHIYYRCTKKKIPCSQRYTREEELDKKISKVLQRFSLKKSWTKRMIEELNKEKEEKTKSKFSFSQKLKEEIENRKNKLSRLLDDRIEGIILKEEYIEKKEKILNQKIKAEQKLETFKEKEDSWLEPAKNFILETNQVQITVKEGTFQEKADFLKKVGSNLVLEDGEIKYSPHGAWRIIGNLSDFRAEPAEFKAGNSVGEAKYAVMRRGWDSNPR